MLEALDRNAEQLGLSDRVTTVATDAEQLPFDDNEFDLVFGHAVLHHLPDLDQAFREFLRVLKPGGTLVFAGEPSRHGDRLASYPKRGAHWAAPAWRRLVGAKPANQGAPPPSHEGMDGHDLESFVDVHAFDPGTLQTFAEEAGLLDVKVRGEELLANWFGWANRTLEATAVPESVPMLWRRYAYHGYIAFQAVDRTLLEPRLPPAIFYNLIVSARAPA
jgi:SAM-dependent methyltransferase